MTKYSSVMLCEAHKDKKNRFPQAAESGMARSKENSLSAHHRASVISNHSAPPCVEAERPLLS